MKRDINEILEMQLCAVNIIMNSTRALNEPENKEVNDELNFLLKQMGNFVNQNSD